MPALSRWYIKTALVYLVLGGSLGGLLLADKALSFSGRLWGPLPLHIEWLLLGWTLQLAMGVAWWILPRPSPRMMQNRWVWSSYGLLNGGLVLPLAIQLISLFGRQPPGWPSLLATLMEVTSVAVFAIAAWPRIGFVPLMVLQKRE